MSQAVDPNGTAPPQCKPPADWAAEIAQYETDARVERFQTPRYAMTFRTLGTGPTLLVLPGISGTPACYAMLLNRLAESFRTVLPDYPGDNPSDGARLRKIAHADLASDALALVDHLRVDRAFVLGISFGSTVALRALAQAPGRFEAAVLQGAFAARKFTPPERLALALARNLPGTVRTLPMHRRVLSWNAEAEFTRPIRARWPIYCEQHAQTRVAALAHRCGLLARLDLTAELPKVACPVLVIHGNEDRIVPKRYYEQVISLLPNVRGCVLPVVGHPVHVTHPEAEARAVAEFLLEPRVDCAH